MEKKKIGWIGLGNIGLPMAKQLVKHGYKVTVCGHTRRQPVKEMKSLGASEVKTIREVAEASDIVFSMVRDVPQTGEVLLGEQGLWEGMRADQILVLSSTLLPSFCEEVEREGKGKGVTVLDAPVSGGPWGAEAGTLTFFVGGEEQAYRKCRPIMEAMGHNVFYLGQSGTGQAAKLANNLMLWAHTLVAGEAIDLARKAGLGPDKLLDTIKVSTGNSWVVQNWRAYMDLMAPRETGVLDLLYKDIETALEYARTQDLHLPFTSLIANMELPTFP
ncbi:MAG: NAD(P)-dependent oxidoreductase [Dehalococcoidia bacterium]|jgi:3-hydroxyisobutyrate dehydrogenase-like beta-hydroxyacid dehydrogenase|nr:NAD(P)-dependent oxidoreductase [Dehalococcoidia bacterium]MDP7469621.1 NAD(P)-dependent oxidoreductase [Dehalococcoidia bacterium]